MPLRTRVVFVAPSMFAPFFRHWYCNPAPEATTLRETSAPNVTFVLWGCALIFGKSITVSVATKLVADPNEFVTTGRYGPASSGVSPVNVSNAFVATSMFVKFHFHWLR